MASLDELREQAKAQARQIESVVWMGVKDLAARWGVSPATVRKIPRDKLAYLEFGDSHVRRYDPRDVEAYEQSEKNKVAA